MKLNPKLLRYMTTEEFRVLTAVEIGSKNHDIVPLELISSIAGLRHGGVHKFVNNLLRNKLVAHDRKHYDGYRLTFSGYDYLALRTFVKRGVLVGIGRQVGVGKESDIHVAETPDGKTVIIKLHRLGRVSFRAIKEKRDYHQGRANASWLYLSRLAAIKEFAFMKALHKHGFPVPTPIDQNRHCCIMTVAPGYPMVQVRRLEEPKNVYRECMAMIMRLARHGLIHGDFNEFNLLLSDKRQLTLIDFPQMISVAHRNSEEFFDRDVEGVRRYFQRQYHYVDPKPVPRLHDIVIKTDLDEEVRASGFDEDKRHNLLDVLEDQRRLRGELEPDSDEAAGESDEDDNADGAWWSGHGVNQEGEAFETIAGIGSDGVDDDEEEEEVDTAGGAGARGTGASSGRKINEVALSFNQRKTAAVGSGSEYEDVEDESFGVNAGMPTAASASQPEAGTLRGVVRHRHKNLRTVNVAPKLPVPVQRSTQGIETSGERRGEDQSGVEDHAAAGIVYGSSSDDDEEADDKNATGVDYFAVSMQDVRGQAEAQQHAVLVDTPFGIASLNPDDQNHAAAAVDSSRALLSLERNGPFFSPGMQVYVPDRDALLNTSQLSGKEKRIFFNCQAQGNIYTHRRGDTDDGKHGSKSTRGKKKSKKKKKLSPEQEAAQRRAAMEHRIKMRVRRQRVAKAERTKKVNRNQNKHRERRKNQEAVRDAM